MPRIKVAGSNRIKPAKKNVASGSKSSRNELANKKIAEGGIKEKRPHRFRPGTVALREIKRYQKQTTYIVPRASFQRYLRSLTDDMDCRPWRFQYKALICI